ncbi:MULTISPECIES: hypothetical protein [unclassified Photobacterium]|uniref:hypothetical protein n=1 Tax=unclassified Photobacterium TaxID=2628852 RepID=UPI001B8B9C96|nr:MULTISPECIES: hypothetical protein [unclassified Photobacterium]MDO6707965.1 hypothetical protein [Photobacterium sp. 1_MG-2023]QUJ68923.1 hypothetical protein KDD30_07570 [Photobacterium sp. GJ3]
MKALISLAAVSAVLLAGCSASVDERANDFVDVSYSLCAAKVQSFSQGDDGKIRVVCDNDSYFSVKSQQTLTVMNELNGAYCQGKGFSHFNERSDYYTFTCLNDKNFNIPK